jgi:hypothetical protein
MTKLLWSFISMVFFIGYMYKFAMKKNKHNMELSRCVY